ncbi:MAG: group II intron reverse transcriptase/maturase [Clostridiales bacterium]|jgi:group II intron reverse transcriptase/maturase|nr:group II intron reverse transcriptase/maturase [Clostridiales bacterium]
MSTTEKAPKKRKLRHAEYYDFQSIQDQLYADSLKGKVFTGLVDIITRPENIKLAYRNIKKNKGSMTAGTDGRTIKDIGELDEERLITLVQKKFKWYIPQSVKRVEIPKDNGKIRPLGIPTIMDRLIQQCVLQVLEPICEAKFHDHSYGFRPTRSQIQAIARVHQNTNVLQLKYVVDVDIKSFFDNVNHGKLLKQLWTLGIRDKKLLCIISRMLKAEVAKIGFPEKGTPQGGIISPLLSNVVLNELDWWIASQWEEFPTKHQYKEQVNKGGGPRKGNKYRALRETELKEITCVRYADDFLIFTNNFQDAVKIFHATKNWLQDRLALEISSEKSKIINLKEDYADFLGFKFKVVKRGQKKNKCKHHKIKWTVESHIKDKALHKIVHNLRRLADEVVRPRGDKGAEYSAVCKYNAYLLGIHDYYKYATAVSVDLKPIAFHVEKNLKGRLKKRIKTAEQCKRKQIPRNMPRVIKERYSESKQIRFVNGNAIIPIGFIQHRFPFQRKWGLTPYTEEGRNLIHQTLQDVDTYTLNYLMRNPIKNRSVEYNDNRLSLYSAQRGRCAITGKEMDIGDIHCHHKTPKNLGGTDKYQNLVLVCVDVHRLIHATDPIVIERYQKKLKLDAEQQKKLGNLRLLLNVENHKESKTA